MKKRIIGLVVSILAFLSAFVLPVGAGLGMLLLLGGMLAVVFFGVRIMTTRGVVPEMEGGGMSKTGHHHKIKMEKTEINNVWDEITAQKLE